MHTDELHYLTGFRAFVGRDTQSLQDFGEMFFVFSVVAAAKMPDLWQHFKRCERGLQAGPGLHSRPGNFCARFTCFPCGWMDGWKF